MIRIPSPLDEETEIYVFETMACGFAVHKAIGPGYRRVDLQECLLPRTLGARDTVRK